MELPVKLLLAACLLPWLLPAAAPRELPDRGAPLYVYCRSGGRSSRAAALLKRMGYTNVTDIGGIADYRGRVVR